MAQCPSCGTEKLFLRQDRCLGCAKVGCDRCLWLVGTRPSPKGETIAHRVCSWTCFDRWVEPIVAQGFVPVPWGPGWGLNGVALRVEFVSRLNQIVELRRRDLQLRHARNLVQAERFEDAAQTFEALGMWREAGETRRIARRNVSTQVSVNVNQLIEQMRSGGLTTTYVCPARKSPIQISGALPNPP